MPGINAYIEQFGNVPFAELPFNDADNFTLNSVFYMPVEQVIPAEFEEKPRTYGEYCQRFYALHNYKMIPAGLVLPKAICKQLVSLSSNRRFSNIKVTGCESVFDAATNTQFCAATFILPDGTLFVLYRGTDDTFCGWKEDVDILVKGTIPSHPLAVSYIERAAAAYPGDIIVSGHSKGGHVALYAAVNCSAETRKRIKCVYNNEGPGYCDYSIFSTDAYRELLPKYKHYVPQSSMIGMMLAHDSDYTVVRSNKPIGVMQHDISSWQIEGCCPVTQKELDAQGKLYEASFARLQETFNREQIESFGTVVSTLVDATGETGLLPFAKNIVPSIAKMVGAWKGIDAATKDTFKKTAAFMGRTVVETAKNARAVIAPAPAAAR